jgi:hypothetical protein
VGIGRFESSWVMGIGRWITYGCGILLSASGINNRIPRGDANETHSSQKYGSGKGNDNLGSYGQDSVETLITTMISGEAFPCVDMILCIL